MARQYGHIQGYEKAIKEMLEQNMTHQAIGDRLGFSKGQIKSFVKRLHEKERRLAAGEGVKIRGKLAKSDKYTDPDKISELKYMLERKDAKIKQLEMENELMRDFLYLTGRK